MEAIDAELNRVQGVFRIRITCVTAADDFRMVNSNPAH
jgi:hypothetical protein